MKKLTAVLLTVLLLVSLLAFGVSADGFVFREESRTVTGDTLTVTWNKAEGEATVEDVLIGGKSYPFTPKDNTITLDLSALPAGEYTVAYEYVAGADQKTATANSLMKEGEATVKLTATIDGEGYVTVTAKNEIGMPISGYQLTLTIGTMSGLTGTTGANGTYKSYLPLDPGATVVYEGLATPAFQNKVVYSAVAAASLMRPAPTTTTTTGTTTTTSEQSTDPSEESTDPSEETTTTTEETTTTTEPEVTDVDTSTTDTETNATIAAAGTTAHVDDKVKLNVSTDQAMLKLFGYEFDAFSEKASLLLSEDDYNGLVGRDNTKLLMLNLLSTDKQVTAAELRTALAGVSAFSGYSEDEREWFTFDLSFLIMDREGNLVPVSAMPLDSTYVVELPVPDSMKDCDKLAITLRDGETMVTPMEVSVKNGTFKLEINSMEAYTLVGFKSEDDGHAGGVSVWVVLLYIVGALLLIGAGLILYFFVFRKPAEEKKTEKDEAPVIAVEPENDNDIFSGRTDISSKDE